MDSIFALRSALDRHRRTLTSSGLRGLMSLLDQNVESGGLSGMKAELDQVWRYMQCRKCERVSVSMMGSPSPESDWDATAGAVDQAWALAAIAYVARRRLMP